MKSMDERDQSSLGRRKQSKASAEDAEQARKVQLNSSTESLVRLMEPSIETIGIPDDANETESKDSPWKGLTFGRQSESKQVKPRIVVHSMRSQESLKKTKASHRYSQMRH
jgi:hypothetical protein